MVKKISLVIAGMIAALLIVIALQPSVFRVERSAGLHAPPEVVFAILNDLHQGARWSPYEKLDPAMKKAFAGPETGPGSSYEWDGNDQAGAGKLTITESRPYELVAMDLDFTRPMVASNTVRYELVPTNDGTRVTWIMEGKNGFVGKAFCMFMDMDGMVGKDFEQGLQNLGEVAVADAKAMPGDSNIEQPASSPSPAASSTPAP